MASICLAVVLLVGCSANNPLVGTWQGEEAGIAITLELRADGSYAMMQNQQKLEGTYTVEGNKVTSKWEDQVNVEYYRIEGDQLMFSILENGTPSLTLKRV